MSRQIHYVVFYDNETGTFITDQEDCDVYFRNGNVWDTETHQWTWIDGEDPEQCEEAHASWSLLNRIIDDSKTGIEVGYATAEVAQ